MTEPAKCPKCGAASLVKLADPTRTAKFMFCRNCEWSGGVDDLRVARGIRNMQAVVSEPAPSQGERTMTDATRDDAELQSRVLALFSESMMNSVDVLKRVIADLKQRLAAATAAREQAEAACVSKDDELWRLRELQKCVLDWTEAALDTETTDAERHSVLVDIRRTAIWSQAAQPARAERSES